MSFCQKKKHASMEHFLNDKDVKSEELWERPVHNFFSTKNLIYSYTGLVLNRTSALRGRAQKFFVYINTRTEFRQTDRQTDKTPSAFNGVARQCSEWRQSVSSVRVVEYKTLKYCTELQNAEFRKVAAGGSHSYHCASDRLMTHRYWVELITDFKM